MQEKHGDQYRIQSTAIESLQHASEAYLVDRFKVARILADHRKQITISDKQMKIVKYLEQEYNLFNCR